MRALGVWLLMLVAMVANGVARLYLLVPWLGERNAELASAAIAIALILLITRPFIRSLGVAEQRLGGIALLWVGLSVAFELGFGHWVAGSSWSVLIANYDLAAGRAWPVVLAMLAASSVIWKPRAPRVVLHFAPPR
jgi:hypothetical protein